MNEKTKKILEELEASPEELDRKELENFRRERDVKKNLEGELELLFEVFPELDIDSIPDAIFEKCPDGKGLAAEYALMTLVEKKKSEEQKVKEEENEKAAVPEVKGVAEEAYFSPEDVRKMSEKEIRKNYKTIMKSMEKWN